MYCLDRGPKLKSGKPARPLQKRSGRLLENLLLVGLEAVNIDLIIDAGKNAWHMPVNNNSALHTNMADSKICNDLYLAF